MYGYSKVDSRTASHPTTAPHAARTSANTASRKTRGMHTMSKTPNQLHHTPTHPRCLRTRLRARRACDADGGADDAGGVVGRVTTLGVVKVVAGLVLLARPRSRSML